MVGLSHPARLASTNRLSRSQQQHHEWQYGARHHPREGKRAWCVSTHDNNLDRSLHNEVQESRRPDRPSPQFVELRQWKRRHHGEQKRGERHPEWQRDEEERMDCRERQHRHSCGPPKRAAGSYVSKEIAANNVSSATPA